MASGKMLFAVECERRREAEGFGARDTLWFGSPLSS